MKFFLTIHRIIDEQYDVFSQHLYNHLIIIRTFQFSTYPATHEQSPVSIIPESLCKHTQTS